MENSGTAVFCWMNNRSNREFRAAVIRKRSLRKNRWHDILEAELRKEMRELRRKDTVTKDYMKQNAIFADAFNYYIYGSQQRILPGQLQELDTTEIAVPYGADDAGEPKQVYRDVMKSVVAMKDEHAAYLLSIVTRCHFVQILPFLTAMVIQAYAAVRKGFCYFIQVSKDRTARAKNQKSRIN